MKFCFFGNVAKALNGETKGGGELQISLLAKALALAGHDVIIIDHTASHGFVTDEGIKLINVPNWNKGPRGMRLFLYRIPALWKLFAQQNADFYYVRMRSYMHLIPFYVARRKGGKFIQGIAHDLDVLRFSDKFRHSYMPRLNLFSFVTVHLPNDIAFNFLLKNSDYVILQHPDQRLMVRCHKPKVVVFRNLIDTSKISMTEGGGQYFAFVGALNVLKGSQNLEKLIKMVHQNIRFIIVGQPTDRPSRKVVERLKLLKNVILKGRLSHGESLKFIAGAKALISTSNYEGFPNIFLEAWAAGVPVISLKVNPDNILNKYKLGVFCNNDLVTMKQLLETFDPDSFDPVQLRDYVEKFHNFNDAANRFLDALGANVTSAFA